MATQVGQLCYFGYALLFTDTNSTDFSKMVNTALHIPPYTLPTSWISLAMIVRIRACYKCWVNSEQIMLHCSKILTLHSNKSIVVICSQIGGFIFNLSESLQPQYLVVVEWISPSEPCRQLQIHLEYGQETQHIYIHVTLALLNFTHKQLV